MQTVYCSRCAKEKIVPADIYAELFTGHKGCFMLCDDVDCMGIYQPEQPKQEQKRA